MTVLWSLSFLILTSKEQVKNPEWQTLRQKMFWPAPYCFRSIIHSSSWQAISTISTLLFRYTSRWYATSYQLSKMPSLKILCDLGTVHYFLNSKRRFVIYVLFPSLLSALTNEVLFYKADSRTRRVSGCRSSKSELEKDCLDAHSIPGWTVAHSLLYLQHFNLNW